jgi:hypothetical protein
MIQAAVGLERMVIVVGAFMVQLMEVALVERDDMIEQFTL